MKVHLFKVEQFFPEALVLEAELKYPLASVDMIEVSGNSIHYKVQEHSVELQLDRSKEFITEVNCTCEHFTEGQSCLHIIMAAWEYRKNGFPETSKSKRSAKGFQISTLIDHVPERDLKQFLSGYAQKNNEIRQLLTLMFSHELESFISLKEVEQQLEKVFKLYKNKLDIKKYQGKLAFYLRTFLGVAEDLLMQKDYRTSLFYNLSSWKIWVKNPTYFRKLNQDDQIYAIILKIFRRIEGSEISPDLYKFMINAIKEGVRGNDFQPVMEIDAPELLVEWEVWDDLEYDNFILNKFMSSQSPENWVTRVLNIVHEKDEDIKQSVSKKFRKIGRDQALRKVTQHYSSLSPTDYLFLHSTFSMFSKEQLRSLGEKLSPQYNFLVQLDLLIQYRELDHLEEILYEQEYDQAHKEYIQAYLKDQTLPSWIDYLIHQNILSGSTSLEELKTIDDPNEWIHLLPHLNSANRKEVIKMIREYCLRYAEDHLGMRAKKHLQSIGRLLMEYDHHDTWNSIKKDLMDRFAHRRSFQSIDNPFS